MFEETQHVETAGVKHILFDLGTRLSPTRQDGQYILLVQDTQFEVFILILEELADLVDEENYLFADGALGKGCEEVDDVVFSEVSQEIAVYVAEVSDVFLHECEGIDEQEDIG